MSKLLRGVVFASSADDEYEGMAHVWVRDVGTAYWFSLSRAVDSDSIQVMVSDQLLHNCDDLSVTLTPSKIQARLSASAASALDGHRDYVIELHPESHDMATIGSALKVIFRDKPGLRLDV